MGAGRMRGTGSWPWQITDSGLYLLNYSLEAVSFTEFIYSEAVQHGLALLRIIKAHKEYEELRYFSQLFFAHVWYPAITFHYAYGPINPWTYYAFTDLYKSYWTKYQSIIGLDEKFFSGYSQEERDWLMPLEEIMPGLGEYLYQQQEKEKL